MILLFIAVIYIWIGGLDWIKDIWDCWNLISLSLEDKNDIILNNLFRELYGLLSKQEFLNYLNNLEQIYNIDLDNVNDMTFDVQEKIKKDLIRVLNEVKNIK